MNVSCVSLSKYHNIKTACLLKHMHDSKGEADYCNTLLARSYNREIKGFSVQVAFNLPVNEKKICFHVVDFVVYFWNDTWEIHEFKGVMTGVWKLKQRLFKAVYPNIPYRLITAKDRGETLCQTTKRHRRKPVIFR